ncbi:replication factor C large subunit [Candidatus Woesearchaeota archaeon]|nr:replication factor C large subunit [Candidatus Woesearchaeota archaeon]
MSLPFSEKYRPEESSKIPQPTAVAQLKQFLHSFNNQKKKGIILYGPSGTGKTSAVHAIAKELKLELIEVNASDVRNTASLKEKLGNALQQISLFNSGKIILVDEVDGVSGSEDRGGVSTLAMLLENSKYPIIMTANDPWDKKFSTLRNKCTLINFAGLDYRTITNILKEICAKESINYEEEDLKIIARRAGGDLRAALNDVQSIASQCVLKKEFIEIIDQRNKNESILQSLAKIFKTTDPSVAVSAFDYVDETPETLLLWIDENLPKEYKGKELIDAYDMLSKANVYLGRIKKRQHWRFLTYFNTLITAGVAVVKREKSKGFVRYAPTTRILKIWKANMKNACKKSLAEKLSNFMHCSKKKIIREIPMIKNIAKNNKKFLTKLEEELELDEKEIIWLSS